MFEESKVENQPSVSSGFAKVADRLIADYNYTCSHLQYDPRESIESHHYIALSLTLAAHRQLESYQADKRDYQLGFMFDTKLSRISSAIAGLKY